MALAVIRRRHSLLPVLRVPVPIATCVSGEKAVANRTNSLQNTLVIAEVVCGRARRSRDKTSASKACHGLIQYSEMRMRSTGLEPPGALGFHADQNESGTEDSGASKVRPWRAQDW